MPRKTPTEELQDGDSQSGSPLLRRSTRIAQSAPASPAGISTRRSSADLGTPGKITKTKRLSLTQESSNSTESVGTPKKTRSLRSASKSPTSLSRDSESGGTPLKGRGRLGSITRLKEEETQSPRAASPILKAGSRSSRSDSLSPTSVKEKAQDEPRTRRGRRQSTEEIETQSEHPKRKTTKGRKLSPILDTIEEKANTSKGDLVEMELENVLKEAASSSKNNEEAKEKTVKSIPKETDSEQVGELNDEGKLIAKDTQLLNKKEEITCVDGKNLPFTKENDIAKENIAKTILIGDSKGVRHESNKEDKSAAKDIQHSNLSGERYVTNKDIIHNDPDEDDTSLKKAKLHDTIAGDITPSKEQDDVNVSSPSKKPKMESAKLINEEDKTCTKIRSRLSLKKDEENETKQTSTKQQSVLSNKGDMTVGLDGSFELHLSLRSSSQDDSDEELAVTEGGANTTNVTPSKCSNKENSKNTPEKSENRLSVEKQKIACVESDKFRKSPQVLIERCNMQTNLSLQNVSVEVERIDLEKMRRKDHQNANSDENEKGLKVPIKPADDYFEKSTERENQTPNEKNQKPLSGILIGKETVLAPENESSGVNTPINCNNEVGEEDEDSLMEKQEKKYVDQQSEGDANQEENLEHNKIEDKPSFDIAKTSPAKASSDKIIEKAMLSNVDEMSPENESANNKVEEVKCHENTKDNDENIKVEISEEFAKDSQEYEIKTVVNDSDNICLNNDQMKKVTENAKCDKGSKQQFPNPMVSSYEDQIIDNENVDKSDNNQIEMDTTSESPSKCSESVKSTDERCNKIHPEEKGKEMDKNEDITKNGIEDKNSKALTADLEHNIAGKEKINIVAQNEGICEDESAIQDCKNIIEGYVEPLTCAVENQINMIITHEQMVENTNLQVTTKFANETYTVEEENKHNKNDDEHGSAPDVDNANIQESDINKSSVKVVEYQSECENGSTNEEATVNVERDLHADSAENVEKQFICSTGENILNKDIKIHENVTQEERDDCNDIKKDDVNVEKEPVCVLDSKLIALIADVSESSSSDEERVSDFIDDMCEEGEEDTPSEGSNDIICKGESLHSDDTEEDTDDDYEEDSFIDDGEDVELLSGNDDLMQEVKPSPKKTKAKYSRIIEVSDSEDEGKLQVSDKVETESKIQVGDKFSRGKSIESKECESDGGQISTTSPSPCMSHEDSNNSSIQLIENNTNRLIDKEDNRKSNQGKRENVKPMVAESVKVINVDSEDDELHTNRNVIEESVPEKGTQNSSMFDLDTSILQKQSKSRSSVNIQENIKFEDIKHGELSERITKVVDWFCSGIKNTKDISGNILLNVSLDYADATADDNIPESTNETLKSLPRTSMDDLSVTIPKKRLSCNSSEAASPEKLRQDSNLISPTKHRRSKTESSDEQTQLVDVQLIQTTSHNDFIERNEGINYTATNKTQKIKNRASCSPLTNRGHVSETKRTLKEKQSMKSNSDDSELEKSIPNETVANSEKPKKKRKKVSGTNAEADTQQQQLPTKQRSLKKRINKKQLESNDNEDSLTVVDVERAYLIPDSNDLVLKPRDDRNEISRKLRKQGGVSKDKETYEMQSNFSSATSKDKRKIHKEIFDCYESGGSFDVEKINEDDDEVAKPTLSRKQKLKRTGRTKITCEEKETNKDSASSSYTNTKSENKIRKNKKLGNYGSKSSVSYFSSSLLEQLPNEEIVTKQEVPKQSATNEPNKRKRNLLAPSKFSADSDWAAESFDVDISLPPKKKTRKQIHSDANSLKLNKNRKNDDWHESFADRDFKNKMLYDPKRVKREDTKILLRTKRAHV